MAQGIILAFINNPVEGNRITFYGTINYVPIVYNNGLSQVDFEYTNNDSEVLADPLHKVKIGADITETLVNTKAFLDNNGYLSNTISIYNQIPYTDGLTSTYITNSNINFEINSDNDNIVINSFTQVTPPTTAPKYLFQYKGITGVDYKCEIYQKNFIGTTTEIIGRVNIEKAEAKDHLDIFRGTGLFLSLEADKNIRFEDLYLGNENDFTVKFYIGGSLMFQGFIKPDGFFESFTDSVWNINLECSDRLGDLADLSFVNTNGLQFSGKMSLLDVIRNCLKRTGLDLQVNTFCNVFYYGIVDGPEVDVLAETYVSVERFLKDDQSTFMSCKEVLESQLRIFNCVITQHQNEWWIYRPSDFYLQRYPLFKKYAIDGNYTGLSELNLNRILGSDSKNFYPHHCNKNQIIEIKPAVSAFRLGYKYGFLASFLKNGTLNHVAGTKIYEGWTVSTWTEARNTGYLVIDPLSTKGISFKAARSSDELPFDRTVAMQSLLSDEVPEGFSFEFKTRFKSYGYTASILFGVILWPSDSSAPYTLTKEGEWTLLNTGWRLYNFDVGDAPNDGVLIDRTWERSFSIKTQDLPKAGSLQITMEVPFSSAQSEAPLVEVKSIELVNAFDGDNVVGEFHTVTRITPITSNVKNNESVFNGDNGSYVYNGAYFMQDQETLTQNWYRRQFTGSEVKPILRISAEDELRLQQRPGRIFSGDVYGLINYITCIEINNIEGVFMPISWKFDTYKNILSMKSLQLFSPELYDIKYEKTLDYGETVKPTIV